MSSSARHHLLLCLGTGPLQQGQTPVDVVRTREYKRARYVRADAPDAEPFETPFVGEALLRLYPGTFTHVHLFGTADSMWDTLWLHLAGAQSSDADETRYLELHEAVKARTLAAGHPWMEALCERFGEAYGVTAHVHVLPLPKSDAATWEMLRRMASLENLGERDTLSLDITHGLRVQPLFLLLAARYLMALKPGLTLHHVFYGALDLRQGGNAPVYDLRAHVALLDWIEAARAFGRYGDAAPVAELLGDHQAKRLTHLARAVQLNALRDLREDARQAAAAYARDSGEAPVPFTMLLPALLELPRTLANTEHTWQAKMLLAQRHARAQNVGLGIMAAWEAVLDRVALVYNLDDRGTQDAAKAVTSIATGHPGAVRAFYDAALPRFTTRTRTGSWAGWKGKGTADVTFGQVAETLRRVRNAIAHADEGLGKWEFEPRVVYQLMEEGMLEYLMACLSHPEFSRLADKLPDWRAALRT